MQCKFCLSYDIIVFHEHYTFCKECAVIYTELIVQETNCEHITDNTITVDNECWYKFRRKSIPYIYKDACSVCGKKAIADGW